VVEGLSDETACATVYSCTSSVPFSPDTTQFITFAQFHAPAKLNMASPLGFRELGSNVSFYEPCNVHDPQTTTPCPDLVILCTWTGGTKASQFARYTTPYQRLYPSARILLVRTTLWDFPRYSDTAFNEYLVPARKTILDVLGDPSTWQSGRRNVLLHILSHGGLRMALQLVQAVQTIDANGTQLPISLMVLECCPGDSSATNIYRAASVALPRHQPARAVAAMGLRAIVQVGNTLQSRGVLTSIDDMRAQLNDAKIFSLSVRKLYLYSLADRMMPFKDVDAHREEALARGYQAERTVFPRAKHMGLMRDDAQKYWDAISNAWMACSARVAPRNADQDRREHLAMQLETSRLRNVDPGPWQYPAESSTARSRL
jgi:hypothetical protein